MPVIGAVAAIGGAAGDVDDPAAAAARLEVEHGEAAKLGGGDQVDLLRALPARRSSPRASSGASSKMPALLTSTSIRPSSRSSASFHRPSVTPGTARSAAIRPPPPWRGVADGALAVERGEDGRADAAAGAGDEDVERLGHALRIERVSPSFQRKLESHCLLIGGKEEVGFQLSLE